MNFDSFVPDVIVAISTGFAVGGGVFAAEWQIGKLRRRREATQAQWKAVDEALPLTAAPFEYVTSLMPEGDAARRISKIVRAVPPEQPSELVPGYFYLRCTADEFRRLGATVDLIEGALTSLAARANSNYLAQHLRKQIVSGRVRVSPYRMEWQLSGVALTDAQVEAAHNDSRLIALVHDYFQQRDLLQAFRDAFSFSYNRYRATSWMLAVHPSRFSNGAKEARAIERKVALTSDVKAWQIVCAVTPYVPPHPWEGGDINDYWTFMASDQSDAEFTTDKRIQVEY